MKALEEEVGCLLLDRVGKKVFLTQAGEQLLLHAEKIVREMDVARGSLKQLNQWAKGRLRIGASASACQYILPPVIREFKKQFPDCLVSIDPGDTPRALELLNEKRIDIAFVLAPEKQGHFETQTVFTDELFFVVNPNHPWATKKHVVRDELPRQQYILYSTQSYTSQMIVEFFRQDGITLNRVMELGSMETIKELIKLDLGVSILTSWIARKEIDEGSLVQIPLGKRRLKRTWCIVHSPEHRLNFAEETFIRLCHGTVGKF